MSLLLDDPSRVNCASLVNQCLDMWFPDTKASAKWKKDDLPWKGRHSELIHPLRRSVHSLVPLHQKDQHYVAQSYGVLFALSMFFMAVSCRLRCPNPSNYEQSLAKTGQFCPAFGTCGTQQTPRQRC